MNESKDAAPEVFPAETRLFRSFAALLTPFLAVGLLWLLWGIVQPHVWFLFYPAVFISSWIGNRRLGVIATAVSALLAWWFFLRPAGSFTIEPRALVQSGVFVATGVAFAYLLDRLTTAVTALGAKKQLDADLHAMTKLHEIGSLFLSERGPLEPVLTRVVDTAVEVSGADFGNIQLLDPKFSELKIIVHHGFPKEWLDYWDKVSAGTGACGTALARGERVIIEDIEQSPIFLGSPALEIQRKASVRAVQSTPLLARSGKPLGMLSTHRRKPHRPVGRELRLLDLLARQAADMIEVWETNQMKAEALVASEKLQGELQQANARLAETSSFLENVFDSSTEYSIIAKDLERRILAWNEGAARLYGYRASELIGRSSDILHAPEEVQSGIVGELHRRALSEGLATGLFRRRRKDGSEFLARVMITRRNDATGKPIGYLIVSHDVTAEQRQVAEQKFLAEISEALQASLDYAATVDRVTRLVVAFMGNGCALDVVEEDGTLRRMQVVHADPAKAGIAKAIEQIPLDRSRPHPQWTVLEMKQALLMSEVPSDLPRALARDEEHRHLIEEMGAKSMILLPLVARGRLMAVLSISSLGLDGGYDAEDLRLAEEVARRAALALDNAQLYKVAQDAIQARDQVLGTVAHELRNPLGAIVVQASVLQKRAAEQDQKPLRAAERIERAATRMNRIIEDLLDLTRMEAGRLSIERARVSTQQLLYESVETQKAIAASAALDVRLEVPDDLPDVWGDRHRLVQVLENLIGNAIKFTESQGRIGVGATSQDGDVHFWVSDTGSGIAAESLPYVFDRFWQAKETERRGTGLGLPIVKGIVEAHGGRVWVESALGEGSTFFFTIPSAAHAEERPTQSPSHVA